MREHEVSTESKAAFQTISREEADLLVLEHRGWAESIARSVARSWNLDWQLDGLDGAAMEALIFCARRFQPARGVPFRGYSRKRIHEASSEAARKSKGWKRGLGAGTKGDQLSREISADLLNVFPELREGRVQVSEGGDDIRNAARQLLMGANILATRQISEDAAPDEMVDYKRMLEIMCCLEVVHQMIMWKTYWEGNSMRTVATEWETDELNVIREHKAILDYLYKAMASPKTAKAPKIRPGLREISLNLKRDKAVGPFSQHMRR